MSDSPDVEAELWKVYKGIGGTDPLEEVDRKLKALELVVKIRSAGSKVKPDGQVAPGGDDGAIARARGGKK